MSWSTLLRPDDISNWSAAVSAIASLIMALLTWRLAVLTKVLATETRLSRQLQERADVQSQIEINEKNIRLIELVVRNVGAGTAKNVVISVDAHSMREVSGERQGLNVKLTNLLPGSDMKFFINTYPDVKKNPVVGNIKFEDSFGSHNQDFVHSVSDWTSFSRISKDPAYDMADALQNIDRTFNRVTMGRPRVQVDVYDREARSLEEQREAARFAEMAAEAGEAEDAAAAQTKGSD